MYRKINAILSLRVKPQILKLSYLLLDQCIDTIAFTIYVHDALLKKKKDICACKHL